MEREKISRKRRGIAVLTLAALFFWYLPQIQVSRQIRKEQEEAVEMYVREEKEENKEENEKSEEVQEQEAGSTDQNLFRTIDFAGLRSKNREICAWLWIPGCALDVPVAHGQDNAYYLTHDAFCRERIYGSIFAPCDTPEDFSERHTILYGHNMRDGTMFGGLKKYREASWKQEFPYLYLYLPGEAWQCRIWSVEETDAKSDVYRLGAWSDADWNAWVQERKENSIIFGSGEEKEVQKIDESEKQVTLTLVNKSDRKLEYWLHMTIARFENDVYQTQNYDDLAIEPGEEKELSLAKGAYRIITTQRQIDGGVSCIASSFVMSEDRVFELRQAPAKIAEKCHEAELSDATVQQVTAEGKMVGDPVLMTSLYQGQKSILVFADPGKEPTEHLFQEILECKEAYKKQGYRVVIALENTDVLKNETLQRVLNAGLNLVCVTVKNDAYLYQMHEALHVGDERLPYAVAVNTEGKGLFAFANYNIRTAWTLMEILDAKG